jgi:hypothetical protein
MYVSACVRNDNTIRRCIRKAPAEPFESKEVLLVRYGELGVRLECSGRMM